MAKKKYGAEKVKALKWSEVKAVEPARKGGSASDDEMKTALLDVAAEMWDHKGARGAYGRGAPEKDGKGFEISVRDWGTWEGDGGSGDYDFQELSKESSKEIAKILQQVEKRHPTVALTFQTGEKNWLYLHAK
jgi:hypothetical protein